MFLHNACSLSMTDERFATIYEETMERKITIRKTTLADSLDHGDTHDETTNPTSVGVKSRIMVTGA